jgi:hypothetical protein
MRGAARTTTTGTHARPRKRSANAGATRAVVVTTKRPHDSEKSRRSGVIHSSSGQPPRSIWSPSSPAIAERASASARPPFAGVAMERTMPSRTAPSSARYSGSVSSMSTRGTLFPT